MIKSLCLAAWLAAVSGTAIGATLPLTYSGRFTDAVGKPLSGATTIRAEFFRNETGGSPLAVTLSDIPATLVSGMFQISLALSDADFHLIFNGTDPAWIQITDVTRSKTYPRQTFTVVPYALKIPIDDTVLKYNSDGQLTFKADPVANRVLGADGAGALTWVDLTGSGLGDMLAGTWDADTNSKIDEADHAATADNATQLGGQAAAYYTNAANIPETATRKWLSDTERTKLAGITTGADMLKSTYDTNADGKADNAMQLNGQAASFYLDAANIPETATRKWLSDTERTKLTGLGTGADMLKSTYDTNADGKVNSAAAADNATQLNGQAASYYLDAANIPETATRKWLSDTERTKLSGLAAGADMLKTTYDTNADGKVNSAVAADTATTAGNATQLNGQAASYYLDAANMTGTILDANIPAAVARDSELPTASSIASGFSADAISGDKVHGGTISNFASVGIDDNSDALAMTIDTSEHVGIGTVSPAGRLDVGGKVHIDWDAPFYGASLNSPAAGGWARSYNFIDSTNTTVFGGFGGYGSGDTFGYLWAGASQASPSIVMPPGGSVGIGTTTPTAKLDVNGSFASNNGAFRQLSQSYSVPTATYVPINVADGVSTLTPSYVYRITLSTTGTATATGAVYRVLYASGVWTATLVSSNGSTSNHPLLRVNGSTLEVYHSHASTYSIQTRVETMFSGNTTATSDTYFGLEGAMSNVNGNVGVGITNPSFKLDVSGAIRSSDVGAGGNPRMWMRAHPTLDIGEIGTSTNHAQTFMTNSTERMRIDNSGNVGIATVSPGTKLDVNGGIRAGSSTVVTATCDGTTEGTQRYNYTSHLMEYCNGTSWTALAANGSGSAKAWVRFNGTNGAIFSSYNVTSVTRTGVGIYTVNITTALADTAYAVAFGSGQENVCPTEYNLGTRTTTQLQLGVRTCNGAAYYDAYSITVVFYR